MNETPYSFRFAFAIEMIGRRPMQRSAAVVLLVAALACHRGHTQLVKNPRCDGDDVLVVYNHSRGAVDIYYSAPKWKKTEFLGTADVGDTELLLPPLYSTQGYRFEARSRSGNRIDLGATAGPNAVSFRQVCHAR